MNFRRWNNSTIVFCTVFMIALLAFGPTFATMQAQSSVAVQDSISCSVATATLNVRSGPGTDFAATASIARNNQFVPVVRTRDSQWVFGVGPAINGWVSSTLLRCAESTVRLPIMDFPTTGPIVQSPPPQPIPTVGSQTGPVVQSPPLQPTPTVGNPPSGGLKTASDVSGSITLLGPSATTLGGRQTFRWRSNSSLRSGEAYDLVLWEVGQEPMQGFSLVPPRNTSQAVVDFDVSASVLPQLINGRQYQWGIIRVRLQPLRRIELLSSSLPFRLDLNSNSTAGPKSPKKNS